MRISDWSSDVCSSDLHCGDTERSVGIDRPADIDRAAAAAVRAHLGRYLPVLVPVGLLGHPVDHAAGTAAPEDHAVGALERLDPLAVIDRKSTRLNSSHSYASRLPTSARQKTHIHITMQT